jgi:hypothetical protein
MSRSNGSWFTDASRKTTNQDFVKKLGQRMLHFLAQGKKEGWKILSPSQLADQVNPDPLKVAGIIAKSSVTDSSWLEGLQAIV